MNAELTAMSKISKAVETATAGLDEGARQRVLGWFVHWIQAQLGPNPTSNEEPTA